MWIQRTRELPHKTRSKASEERTIQGALERAMTMPTSRRWQLRFRARPEAPINLFGEHSEPRGVKTQQELYQEMGVVVNQINFHQGLVLERDTNNIQMIYNDPQDTLVAAHPPGLQVPMVWRNGIVAMTASDIEDILNKLSSASTIVLENPSSDGTP